MKMSFNSSRRHASHARRGWSLLELTVVLAVMGVLLSFSAPSVGRSLEQSRADLATANLRAIWSAERLYWLEYGTFTADVPQLASLGLVDPTLVSDTSFYAYAIANADVSGFTAGATRTGSSRWFGAFTIDQNGVVTGAVRAAGQSDIVPGFQ